MTIRLGALHQVGRAVLVLSLMAGLLGPAPSMVPTAAAGSKSAQTGGEPVGPTSPNPAAVAVPGEVDAQGDLEAGTSDYAAEVMADSPMAYWRLNETAGTTANDSSGNGHNGTIVGGVTLGAPGALYGDPDPAMRFNGVDGHVAVRPGFSDFPNGLTVEAWVYPTSNASFSRIVDFGSGPVGDNIIFSRYDSSDSLAFEVYSAGVPGGKVISPAVLRLNTWQYVAATLDASGRGTIYYSGLRVAAGQTAVPRNVPRAMNYVGRSHWGDPYYAGSIDEVAIYPYVLSQERLLSHFAAAGRTLGLETWGQPLELLGLDTRASSRDPVDTGSGIYTYAHTDLAVPGRGPSVAFSRDYNSADGTVGPLGPGWTHNYNSRIVRDQSGRIAVVSPNGRRDVYASGPGGTFTPPPGVDSSLTRDPATGNYILVHRDQTAWTFNTAGKLIGIADRYGNQSTLGYNANGQLTSVADPAGRGSLTLSYDTCRQGRLCSITDWASPPRVVQYGYDSSGRLTSVTDREGKITTYGYDGTSSRLTTITDARGNVAVTNTYDAQGRVATQKDAKGLLTGEQTTFDYTSVPSTTVVTYPATSFDPGWHPTVADTYDAQSRLIRQVSKPTANPAEDVVQEYGYDAHSFRASVKDGRGNVTNFCYDVDYAGAAIAGSFGNLTRRIDPPPGPGANRPVTLYKYDGKNNLVQEISPLGVNAGPEVSCSTDLSSAVGLLYATDYAYDSATQAKLESTTRRYTDPELGQQTAVTKLEYNDPANPGLVTTVIPPHGNTAPAPDYSFAVTSTYFVTGTKAGLLESTIDALGNKTTYDYDAVGRRTKMVDPNGNAPGAVPAEHTWEYTYDREDRLLLSKAPAPQPGGGQLVTESRHDAVGNREVVIDANGQVTKYVYDERDGLVRVLESPSPWADPADVPAYTITTEYQYDNGGNLSRVTRAKASADYERVVNYAYDGTNRLRQEIQYPAWPVTTTTLLTEYTYDANGNRLTLRDPLGQTTTFGYDALNRVTSVGYSDGTTPNVSYGYDANGNRTAMVDGTGTTSYVYDELSRVLSVTDAMSKTVGYRYDPGGNRTKLIYPDGTAVSYVFDKANRLESLLDWASRTTSYQYFPSGSLKTVVNFNGTTAEYSYDNAQRLLDVWNKKGTKTVSRHTYTLDAAGNRTAVDELLPELGRPGKGTPASTSYGYDGLYRLTSVSAPEGPTAYGYDPVGNRLSMARSITTTYDYDRADRIEQAGAVSYTVNANGNLVARGADTFGYDQANRLVTAVVSGTIGSYTYDGDGKRAGKTVGGATTSYVYDANRALPVVLEDGARKYVWGNGLAYAVDGAGNAEVYYVDGLGSVRAIANASAEVVQTYRTDEFGVPIQTQGSSTQPFQYTGEQGDPESGLVYLRARYYEPAIGRFLSRDPVPGLLVKPVSLNPYVYVHNDPVNLTDPSGEIAWVPILVAAWALYEVGSQLVDAYSTASTLLDPHAGSKEKASSVGLFVVGIVAPGGGYATAAKQGFSSFAQLKGALGSPGVGKAWHHLVEQRLAGRQFPAELIHTGDNVVAVTREVNQQIANYYSRIRRFTNGQTVRKWLESQPFAKQREFGVDILDRITGGKPLP